VVAPALATFETITWLIIIFFILWLVTGLKERIFCWCPACFFLVRLFFLDLFDGLCKSRHIFDDHLNVLILLSPPSCCLILLLFLFIMNLLLFLLFSLLRRGQMEGLLRMKCNLFNIWLILLLLFFLVVDIDFLEFY
jgi:hypothetical protein